MDEQTKKYKQKRKITRNRPIYIYSHSHLGLCRKHLDIASKITISRIAILRVYMILQD